MSGISVVAEAARDKAGRRCVLARCVCGKLWCVRLSSLTSKNSQSCGCLRDTKNKDSQSSECSIWRKMLRRCENPRDAAYSRYGGRGISVCKRWHLYAAFLQDMGRRPTPAYSLDRIDNDGNYTPNNCRWATRKQQANNRRPRRWWRKPRVENY